MVVVRCHGYSSHKTAGAKELYRTGQDGKGCLGMSRPDEGKTAYHACPGLGNSLFQETAQTSLLWDIGKGSILSPLREFFCEAISVLPWI